MMNSKEQIIEKLNDVIFKFEDSSKIVDYAIVFNERVVLAPNTTYLTKQKVLDILNNLNIENSEKNFQKGVVNLMSFEFEEDMLYYVRSTPQIRIIASTKNLTVKDARKNLLDFAMRMKTIIKPLSEPTVKDETEEKINQALARLDALVKEFKIPKFEGYKKLVKFAIPFKKK